MPDYKSSLMVDCKLTGKSIMRALDIAVEFVKIRTHLMVPLKGTYKLFIIGNIYLAYKTTMSDMNAQYI